MSLTKREKVVRGQNGASGSYVRQVFGGDSLRRHVSRDHASVCSKIAPGKENNWKGRGPEV